MNTIPAIRHRFQKSDTKEKNIVIPLHLWAETDILIANIYKLNWMKHSGVRFMVYIAIFNNISVLSWRALLLSRTLIS